MIGKSQKKSRKQLSSHIVCTYCDGRVIEEKIETSFKFLFIVFYRSIKKFLNCDSCDRTLVEGELKELPKEELREHQYDDGKVKMEYIERGISYEKKKTIYDTKNQLPQTKNPELLSMTIVGLMALMTKYDATLHLANSENYDYINESYQAHQLSMNTIENIILDQPKEEGKEKVLSLFKKCVAEFNKNELHFIISQSLGMTRSQFVLNYEVNELFKILLLEMNFGELGLDSAILNFRSKWNG